MCAAINSCVVLKKTVRDARAAQRAAPFKPHGKPKMREWIMLAPQLDQFESIRDLLCAALDYAAAHKE